MTFLHLKSILVGTFSNETSWSEATMTKMPMRNVDFSDLYHHERTSK